MTTSMRREAQNIWKSEQRYGGKCEKYKNSQKTTKGSPTAMDVLYSIILHNDGNVDKKFQPFILNSSREKHISPIALRTDRHSELNSSFATKNKRYMYEKDNILFLNLLVLIWNVIEIIFLLNGAVHHITNNKGNNVPT